MENNNWYEVLMNNRPIAYVYGINHAFKSYESIYELAQASGATCAIIDCTTGETIAAHGYKDGSDTD